VYDRWVPRADSERRERHSSDAASWPEHTYMN